MTLLTDGELDIREWSPATHPDHIDGAEVLKVVNTVVDGKTGRTIYFDNGRYVTTEDHQYPEKTDPMLHPEVVFALDRHNRRIKT